jgi:hypothetical protein
MSVYWLPYDTSEQITLIDSLVDSVHPFYNEKTILDGIKQNLINYFPLTDMEITYLEKMIQQYGYLLE